MQSLPFPFASQASSRNPISQSVKIFPFTQHKVLDQCHAYHRYISLTSSLLPERPDLSVSYITLTGFARCFIYGIDGSETYLISYGIPQTVPVGPPQVQVNGTCGPHRAAGQDL